MASHNISLQMQMMDGSINTIQIYPSTLLAQLATSTDSDTSFTGIFSIVSRGGVIFSAFDASYFIIFNQTVNQTVSTYLLPILGTPKLTYLQSDVGPTDTFTYDLAIVDGIEINIQMTGLALSPIVFTSYYMGTSADLLMPAQDPNLSGVYLMCDLEGYTQSTRVNRLGYIPNDIIAALKREYIPLFSSPKTQVVSFIDRVTNIIHPTLLDKDKQRCLSVLNKHLTQDCTYIYPIKDIFATGGGVLGGELINETTVILYTPHSINQHCKVTLSGFKGEWSIFNGDIPLYWYCCNYEKTPPYLRDPTAQIYFVTLSADSSSLPRYNRDKHGNGFIKTTIEKLTDKSDFGPMMATMLDVMREIGWTTHNYGNIWPYYDTISGQYFMLNSFRNLYSLSSSGYLYQIATSGDSQAPYISCGAYSWPYLYSGNLDTDADSTLYDTVANYVNYDVIVNNYLYSTTVVYPHFQVVTDNNTLSGLSVVMSLLPDGSDVGDYNNFFGNGNNVDKTIIVRETLFYSWAEGYNLYNSVNGTGLNNMCLCVGLINQSFTGSKRVGYLRIRSEEVLSPFLNEEISPEIYMPQSSNVAPAVYFAAMYAQVILDYLNSLNIDALVFDTMINEGGYLAQSVCFTSIFGAVRKAIYMTYTDIGDGANIHTIDNTIQNFYNINSDMSNFQLNPKTSIDTTFPLNNPLSNMPVSVLISRGSESAGDLIIDGFFGDNLDGDVGNGVQVKVYGELDGVIKGYSGYHYQPCMSDNYVNLDGSISKFSPLSQNLESTCTFYDINANKITGVHKKEFRPHTIFNYSSKHVKEDFGVLPSPISYIASSVAPNPSDPTTWKCQFLEKVLYDLTGPVSIVNTTNIATQSVAIQSVASLSYHEMRLKHSKSNKSKMHNSVEKIGKAKNRAIVSSKGITISNLSNLQKQRVNKQSKHLL